MSGAFQQKESSNFLFPHDETQFLADRSQNLPLSINPSILKEQPTNTIQIEKRSKAQNFGMWIIIVLFLIVCYYDFRVIIFNQDIFGIFKKGFEGTGDGKITGALILYNLCILFLLIDGCVVEYILRNLKNFSTNEQKEIQYLCEKILKLQPRLQEHKKLGNSVSEGKQLYDESKEIIRKLKNQKETREKAYNTPSKKYLEYITLHIISIISMLFIQLVHSYFHIYENLLLFYASFITIFCMTEIFLFVYRLQKHQNQKGRIFTMIISAIVIFVLLIFVFIKFKKENDIVFLILRFIGILNQKFLLDRINNLQMLARFRNNFFCNIIKYKFDEIQKLLNIL